jgi:hypothetical protein
MALSGRIVNLSYSGPLGQGLRNDVSVHTCHIHFGLPNLEPSPPFDELTSLVDRMTCSVTILQLIVENYYMHGLWCETLRDRYFGTTNLPCAKKILIFFCLAKTFLLAVGTNPQDGFLIGSKLKEKKI